MSYRSSAFLESLDQRVDAIASACTACGACAEACPTIGVAGLEGHEAGALTAGVRDILQSGAGPAASESWATMCCGSGKCLTVCPEGINPRFMLTMARRSLSQGKAAPDRRLTGARPARSPSRR